MQLHSIGWGNESKVVIFSVWNIGHQRCSQTLAHTQASHIAMRHTYTSHVYMDINILVKTCCATLSVYKTTSDVTSCSNDLSTHSLYALISDQKSTRINALGAYNPLHDVWFESNYKHKNVKCWLKTNASCHLSIYHSSEVVWVYAQVHLRLCRPRWPLMWAIYVVIPRRATQPVGLLIVS